MAKKSTAIISESKQEKPKPGGKERSAKPLAPVETEKEVTGFPIIGLGSSAVGLEASIKRHGGCIDVELEPGNGSAFHIYLPVSKNVSAAATTPQSATTHKGTGRILLMDDEDFLRESLGYILESMGYSVISAKDGHEALNILAEEEKTGRSFVAVILDLIVKGGMGGREAIGEIRKLNPGIPVFVSSGYSEDPVMSRPSDYGFTDSICKPFSKFELVEMLNRNMI